MAFIPLPNTIKLVIEYTIGGKLQVNVLFVRKATTVVTDDLSDVCDVADGWDITYGQNIRSTGMAVTQFVATDESAVNGGAFIKTLQPARPGVVGGALNPNNVAAVLSLRTGLRGRSFRGRTYIGGQLEGNNIGDEINADYIEDVLDAYDQFQSLMLTAGFTWVVASRYSNNAPRLVGVTTTISELRMNTRIDTQRRRLD